MNLRNSVFLIGNLGSDPTIINLEKGNKIAKFSIATKEYFKQEEEYKEKVTWHNIVAWGANAAKVEKTCLKGCEVVINGKLTNRSYDDKTGVKHYVTEVVVNEIICRAKTQQA